jgi:hypothetical protein
MILNLAIGNILIWTLAFMYANLYALAVKRLKTLANSAAQAIV